KEEGQRMAGEGVPRGATLPVEYRAAEEEDRGTYLFAMKLRRTKSTGDVTKANVTKGDGTKGDVTSNAAATVAGDNGWGDSRRKGRERIGTVFEAEERGGLLRILRSLSQRRGRGLWATRCSVEASCASQWEQPTGLALPKEMTSLLVLMLRSVQGRGGEVPVREQGRQPTIIPASPRPHQEHPL
ncbi:hypothetical protein CLOP_g18454, partial [Closterium sp. NIES-67]